MRWLVLVPLLTGCAALIDPANHGTPWMRSQWAKAEPCVTICSRKFPNETVLAIRTGDICACKTDRNLPMGESYYGEDHAPAKRDDFERFKLPTMEEAMNGIMESVRQIVAARCPVPR